MLKSILSPLKKFAGTPKLLKAAYKIRRDTKILEKGGPKAEELLRTKANEVEISLEQFNSIFGV